MFVLEALFAGMDPVSQATAWNALSQLDCSCMLIATGSLEECKALCTRMCVMVDGCIEAIGSVGSLKHKYGACRMILPLWHNRFPV